MFQQNADKWFFVCVTNSRNIIPLFHVKIMPNDSLQMIDLNLARTCKNKFCENKIRGGSRATATSKMERFVIIVNGWKPLTIITKRSILDVAAALDPPLKIKINWLNLLKKVSLRYNWYGWEEKAPLPFQIGLKHDSSFN